MSKRQVFTSKTSFTVLQCIRESASNGAYEWVILEIILHGL
jgi:hypothetical protein